MKPLTLALVAGLLLAGCSAPDDGPLEPAPDSKWNVRWSAGLPAGALSSPANIDLNGDGALDAIIMTGMQPTADNPEPIDPSWRDTVALDGRNGRLLWTVATGGVDSSPAVGDLDDDGEPDIVIGFRESQTLVRMAADGEYSKTFEAFNWVHSAAFYDVDGDGGLEIVAVTGGAEGPPGHEHEHGPAEGSDRPVGGHPGSTGEIIVFEDDLEVQWRVRAIDEAYTSPAVGPLHTDGSGPVVIASGYGGELSFGGGVVLRDATGDMLWNRTTRTGVLSSPVLVDLDGDGTRDVVTGTWWGAIHAYHGATGEDLWNHETGQLGWSSPALGEWTGDDLPDVVVTGYRTPDLQFESFESGVNDKGALGRGVAGRVAAYEGATGALLWETDVPGSPTSPATSDLDGDGTAEVLVFFSRGDTGFSGADGGTLWVLNGTTGEVIDERILPSGGVGTPSIRDLDGDGRAEVTLVTLGPAMAIVMEWEEKRAGEARWAWPQWRGDDHNTGHR